MLVAFKSFLNELRNTCETCLRLLFFIRFKKTIHRQNNKTLVILGNGPSLNEFIAGHQQHLESHSLMCVNYFPATPAYEVLKPSYFITSAPELWLDDVEEVYVKFRNELFTAMAQKTTWPLVIFIPWEAKRSAYWQQIIGANSNISISYYNVHPVEGFRGFRHFLFNRQLGMPRPHNVLGPAIITGIHLGFENIILTGADHSWLPLVSVDGDNRVLVNQKHFYDHQSSQPDVMRKSGKGQRKLHEVLHKFMLAFESYFIIREYAEAKKIKILNITPGSYIDAFERADQQIVADLASK